MTMMQEAAAVGQSIWLDFIRRSFLDSGELGELVADGLRGVTSNPSIFQKAITASTDYDAAVERLVGEGRSVNDIYEALAIQDIRRACDIMQPVYDSTDGLDGYVSLEVNPKLAYDTEGTVMEARRLSSLVDRANVMIKVPATPQGIPAIETLTGEGININVTLIFSLQQYEDSAMAYIHGLEKLAAANVDFSRVASVASFFVSRFDTEVDARLASIGTPAALALRGRAAVANARVAYLEFLRAFSSARWYRLRRAGANVQKPLWASTSTKNPAYSDTLYIDTLVAPETVNTLPESALAAYEDRGPVSPTVLGINELNDAVLVLDDLASAGVDYDDVTAKLEQQGVAGFVSSFRQMIGDIESKRDMLTAIRGEPAPEG